jgi:hypothetical protein
MLWGGPGVEPRGLHIILHIYNNINQPMRDTWRPCIGPRVPYYLLPNDTCQHRIRQRTTNKYAMSSNCHVIMMVRPSTWPYGLYGQVQSASQIFTCLAWRTDRDISSIRTPFAKVNIPPESGRRDGRNGTVFVAFRAL